MLMASDLALFLHYSWMLHVECSTIHISAQTLPFELSECHWSETSLLDRPAVLLMLCSDALQCFEATPCAICRSHQGSLCDSPSLPWLTKFADVSFIVASASDALYPASLQQAGQVPHIGSGQAA